MTSTPFITGLWLPGESRVAVIGAGIMGPGIAQVFAEHGYSVDLCDVSTDMLRRAAVALEDGLQLKAERGLIAADEADAARARVRMELLSDELLAKADLIIEAVSERTDIKRDLYERIDHHGSASCVVWSNTSTLDVFALAPAGLRRRLLVAHWFAPPHILPLVEVVASEDTAPHLLDVSLDCLRALGKTPVVLEHFVPGFIINRLLRSLGREAFHLLEQGVISIEGLDAAVRTSLAPRMQVLGVLQRYDFTGLGLSLRNLENPEMVDAPVDLAPPALRTRVARGDLGITTGSGFYDYGGRDPNTLQRERDAKLWDLMAALGDDAARPKPI